MVTIYNKIFNVDMLIAEGVKNVLPNIELNSGADTLEAAVAVYRQFYSKEDEQKSGVVAIKLRVVRSKTRKASRINK